MTAIEMPEVFDVPNEEPVDLDAIFSDAPAVAEQSQELAEAKDNGAAADGYEQPDSGSERPIESFLPEATEPEQPVEKTVATGVDLAMREVMEQIIEQNDFIRTCEGEVEDAKAELKMAKENFDKAVERLRELCTKLEFFRKADENDAARPLLSLQSSAESSGEEEEGQLAADNESDLEPGGSDTEEVQNGTEDTDEETETAIRGTPVKLRVTVDVYDGPKLLVKQGEEFEVSDIYADGEIAVEHVDEGGIVLRKDEFEVIEWEHSPKSAESPLVELQKFLGCSEAQAQSFAEYGIQSVDELRDALADGIASGDVNECMKVLTAVKGVGKKKAEKILELVKARG